MPRDTAPLFTPLLLFTFPLSPSFLYLRGAFRSLHYVQYAVSTSVRIGILVSGLFNDALMPNIGG